MTRDTGKQRSQRIQIDYYRRQGGLHHLKIACVIAGLAGAGLYAVYVLAAGGGQHISTGPLSVVHASFEDDCQQCHQDFTPLNSRAVQLNWSLVGLDSSKSVGRIESACQKCHRVGDHYRETMKAESKLLDQNCASCHVDHQGRSHNLTFLSNRKCVSCHANLADVCSAAPTVRSSVLVFDKDQHGDFASLDKQDPGGVKFDHHQHMLPGQVNADRKGAFTIEMLDESLRNRYRKAGQDDSSPVTLDCSSCHRMTGNQDASASMITPDELGRYMEPISFERHCSACHSMNPGLATANTTPLPHAVPWAKIDLLLAATARGARISGQTRTPRDDRQSTPRPGEGLGNPAPADSLDVSFEVAAARNSVETQCLQCHEPQVIADDAIRAASAGTANSLIPGRWLEHGLYDHGAHYRIDCRYCHESAYPTNGSSNPATDHKTVMIAGIESCTGCHRDPESPTPASLASADVKTLLGGQPTWASANCTLCHRYHAPVAANVEDSR